MKKINWKSLAFSSVFAAALVAPSVSSANWSAYKLNPIAEYQHFGNQALAVNSLNRVCGLGYYGTGQSAYTGILGGPNLATSYFIPYNNWTTVQWNALNNGGDACGVATISGHPTAVAYPSNGSAINLIAGINYAYYSFASSINHAGTVLGAYHREDPQGLRFHMFRWDPVTKTRTGEWVNLLPGGINENGLMAATNLVPTNYYQLQELALVPPSGAPTMYTAPGYFVWMQPNAVSTSGGVTVVGDMLSYIYNGSNSKKYGFVFNRTSGKWDVLTGPGGVSVETHGLAVDQGGTKLAGYTVDIQGNQNAAVWEFQSGQWVETDVSSLVPSDLTWQYNQATGISPLGAISGIGKHLENGKWVTRGFVLTPNNQVRMSQFEGGIYGGVTVSPKLTLVGADMFPIDVDLSSPTRTVRVPRQIRVPGGQQTVQFNMNTDGVDAKSDVIIDTSIGGAVFPSRVTLLPAILGTLNFSPEHRGKGGVGYVNLRGAAGPSGAIVSLSSSDPRVTVPARLRLEFNESAKPFEVKASTDVAKGTVVTITAHYCDGSVSQPFTVG